MKKEDLNLFPTKLSFEELKKHNEHGAEYWSARELQSCLGYSKWQRFENAVEKAKESCKQSGNNPDYHFTGAGKPIVSGKRENSSRKYSSSRTY